ncbi:nucleotide-binding universal stress UspA family protein [Actinoplanes tereljensis]|uniref:Universal stress protein A n=1 Tax=Paractinoplanes tereljensis TaxID=571912 RepID=A0A919NYP5_9ACTN|nr:universal stress protein [Actinoplanes tereljensis]GIF26788.1 universal stress protein A [Actinoplanes tereljensis]
MNGVCSPAAIVVGIDGSPSSLRAGAYAAGLARRQHARLVAVYARAQPGGLLAVVDTSGAAVATTMEIQDQIETELVAAARTQLTRDVDAQLLVRFGDPFTVLCEVAREVQAGTVIVGRSDSLAHRIAGSLALRLVKCGRWPVTVVP